MSGITELVNHIQLPRFVKVHQNFPHTELSQDQMISALDAAFAARDLDKRIRPGQRICITAGSRGVSNLTLVTKYVVDRVKKLEAQPFLIPAMGSHGGATAEGQVEILESLGITEASMGCPILSSMETVELCQAGELPVHMDKYAYEADGIILINRVKAHTSFQGPYESGLMKMMAVGLGKQKGANALHSKGPDFNGVHVEALGKAILSHHDKILLGVALMENAYDLTSRVEVIPGECIAEEEPGLLTASKKEMGRLCADACDVLIVGKLGKNFSGAGMDPNIVGRSANPKLKMGIAAQRIGLLDLSDESHGNATGMGRADLATRRFFDKVSFDTTYPQFVTGYQPYTFMMPIIIEDDRELLQTAVATCQGIDYENPRIVMVKNSLEIDHILVSEALIPEVGEQDYTEIVTDPFALEFDEKGNLLTAF